MNISKTCLLAFLLLLSGLPKIVFAQVENASDSAEDNDEVVDPDYKPMTRTGNTVNGKWYGIGNVATTTRTNSYLCELLLKENKNGSVTGYFNYFFRDGYFSNRLFGTYDKATQTFKIKPVIILFHQTVKADIGVDVPMYGNFILNLNNKDTTLTGFLSPIDNYKYLVPALNIKLSIVGKNEPTLKERIRRRKLELEEDPDIATVMNEANDSAGENLSTNKTSYRNYRNDIVNSNNSVKKRKDIVAEENVNSIYRSDSTRNVNNTTTVETTVHIRTDSTAEYPNTQADASSSSYGYKNDIVNKGKAKSTQYGNDRIKNNNSSTVKGKNVINVRRDVNTVYRSDSSVQNADNTVAGTAVQASSDSSVSGGGLVETNNNNTSSYRSSYQNDIVKKGNTNSVQYKNDVIKNKNTNSAAKGRNVISFEEGLSKIYQLDSIRNAKGAVAEKKGDSLHFSDIKSNYQNDTIKFKQQLSAVNQAIEDEYKLRSTNLFNTVTVNDDSVTVSLYDNGEFDHDMVSVFFNGKLIASNIELKTNVATKLVVHLDTAPDARNELTLFAENLGTIPPNSALMIVEDTHNNRFEINLKSDLSHNASILLIPKPM